MSRAGAGLMRGVGLGDEEPPTLPTGGTGPYAGGPNRRVLSEVVARTGGLLYERPAGTALPALFRTVLEDFHTSYLLSYTPCGVTRQGWHDVTVGMKDRTYVARARKVRAPAKNRQR